MILFLLQDRFLWINIISLYFRLIFFMALEVGYGLLLIKSISLKQCKKKWPHDVICLLFFVKVSINFLVACKIFKFVTVIKWTWHTKVLLGHFVLFNFFLPDLPDLSEGCIMIRIDKTNVSSLFLHCILDLKFKSGKIIFLNSPISLFLACLFMKLSLHLTF